MKNHENSKHQNTNLKQIEGYPELLRTYHEKR